MTARQVGAKGLEAISIKEKMNHVSADYDVSEVLTRWGNWARKEAYLQRQSFTVFKSEQTKFKESLTDDDGLLIDSIVAALGKLKSRKSQHEYQVLTLYYFGEISLVDDKVMIIRQSLRAISQKMGISKSQVDLIKSSAEGCIVGMLAMQTMLTGTELTLLRNLKYY